MVKKKVSNKGMNKNLVIGIVVVLLLVGVFLYFNNQKEVGLMPECSSDADCNDPTKPVCYETKCGPRPRGEECSNDADCKKQGMPACSLISKKCVQCNNNNHCKDPTKPVCYETKCGPR